MVTFGRYRLEQRLGQGGMAEVFRATAMGDNGIERTVAVKRMLPELAQDPVAQRMFLDEARIGSRLHHSGIVSVIDFGIAEGVGLQVLEYVDGVDAARLLRMLRNDPPGLPLGLALHIGVQVARALDYAHEVRDASGQPLNVVHRDVSPSNVLLGRNGDVRLSDFGIALADNRLEKTQAGGVKGKTQYMAPEQASQGRVDRRADIFSLACTVHALCVGMSPLAQPGAIASLMRGERPTLDARLPEAATALLLQALSPDPADRPQTAALFADLLGQLCREVLKEEPRGALIRFLADVNESQASARSPTALDQLLDLDLVLRGTTVDGLRSFEFTDKTRVEARTSTAGSLERESTPPDLAEASPARKRVQTRTAVLVLVLLVLGTALLRNRVTRIPSTTVPPRRVQDMNATQKVNSAPPPKLTTEALDQPKHDAAVPRAEVRTPPVRAPSAPRSRSKSEPTPANSDMGSVVIGGPGALRAEIRVDGRLVGYAPRRVDVPLGDHRFELVAADGRPIASRRIEVTVRHTPSEPARFLVP